MAETTSVANAAGRVASMYQVPELYALWLRGRGDCISLGETELVRFSFVVLAFFGVLGNAYFQAQGRMVEDVE